MNKRALEQKTHGQLLTLAARAGIRGRSRMRKKLLVIALSKRRPPRSKASRPPRSKPRKSRTSAPHTAEPRARYHEMTELPSSYGQTRLVLMEVDPHLVHAYWEVTPADRKAATKRLRAENTPVPWVLRFYEIAASESGGMRLRSCFDVPVDLAPGNWYVNLPAAGKSYRAELGPVSGSGRFHAACRSNAVSIPCPEVSPRFQPRWLEVGGDFKFIQRVPEPPPEPSAWSRSSAGPAMRGVRADLSWPLDELEIHAGREEPLERTAPNTEACATAEPVVPGQGGSEIKGQAQPAPSLDNISSFALGGPGRKSAGVGPASGAKPRRSD
jgi:hypothetical protein